MKTLGMNAALMAVSTKCSSDRQPERSNIIFLLTDDQRWDTLGCAGNKIIQTPNLDRLAAEGVHFANAFVTTPICAASRASLFTGLYERKHQYTFGTPPVKQEYIDFSYPLQLRVAGYRTGFIGKFGVKVLPGATEKMFDMFKPLDLPYIKKVDGKERHLTDIIGDEAIRFLDGDASGKPFCLSISFNAPHAEDDNPRQYIWPPQYDDLYKDVTIPPPPMSDAKWFEAQPEFVRKGFNRVRWYWRFDTPEKYQQMVKGYYRMISHVDTVVGHLRQALADRGLDSNTIIIFTSDNGYFLGERGLADKWLMYEPSLRVPLIIYDPRAPKQRRGLVLEQMALNIDIPPTILSMAGLTPPPAMQGRSLTELLEDPRKPWRAEFLCEHLYNHPSIPSSEGVRTEKWKYFRYRDYPGFEELYYLADEPMEEHNLAADPAYRQQLEMLRHRCDQLIA